MIACIAFLHTDLYAPIYPPEQPPVSCDTPTSTLPLICGGHICGERVQHYLPSCDDVGYMCPCNPTGSYYYSTCYCDPGFVAFDQNEPFCRCTSCTGNTYNKYTSFTGSTCTSCPPNTQIIGTSYTDHDSPDDCQPMLEDCPTGQYSTGPGNCTPCPVGAKDSGDNDVRGQTVSLGKHTLSDCFMPSKDIGNNAIVYKNAAGKFTVPVNCRATFGYVEIIP